MIKSKSAPNLSDKFSETSKASDLMIKSPVRAIMMRKEKSASAFISGDIMSSFPTELATYIPVNKIVTCAIYQSLQNSDNTAMATCLASPDYEIDKNEIKPIENDTSRFLNLDNIQERYFQLFRKIRSVRRNSEDK